MNYSYHISDYCSALRVVFL